MIGITSITGTGNTGNTGNTTEHGTHWAESLNSCRNAKQIQHVFHARLPRVPRGGIDSRKQPAQSERTILPFDAFLDAFRCPRRHISTRRHTHSASSTRHRSLTRPNRAKSPLRRVRRATRRYPKRPGALPKPKGPPSASFGPTDRCSASMSDARATDQSSCRRAGMQRGRSEACAACSGCDEDRGNIRRTRWCVRIERICSPLAMHSSERAAIVEEGILRALRMGPSSRFPRSRTSPRPEDAAAPSTSRRLTSLCFDVAHCGARGQTVAVSASWPGKQLDSPEERETELSMSWVSSAVTCTAKFRMHQQGALPWALAIFWLIYLESAR